MNKKRVPISLPNKKISSKIDDWVNKTDELLISNKTQNYKRLTINIDKELHKVFKKKCFDDDISMGSQISFLIEHYLK